MSATNATTNYSLPIFQATDKPAWLTDWNGAMGDIDTAIKAAQTAADNAGTAAASAASDITTINSSINTINSSLTSLTTNVNTNTGAINTINSLIGNGTPTTTDQTIIGAINELHADITGGGTDIDADNIDYDNTTSGLTATDVQAAIDEVVTMIPGAGGYDFDLSAHTGTATVTSTATIEAASIIKYALNQDGSIGKIYGFLQCPSFSFVQNTDNVVATISIPDLPTITQEFEILVGGGPLYATTYGAVDTIQQYKLVFKTNKTIDVVVPLTVTSRTDSFYFTFPPCIYFFTDFGD